MAAVTRVSTAKRGPCLSGHVVTHVRMPCQEAMRCPEHDKHTASIRLDAHSHGRLRHPSYRTDLPLKSALDVPPPLKEENQAGHGNQRTGNNQQDDGNTPACIHNAPMSWPKGEQARLPPV